VRGDVVAIEEDLRRTRVFRGDEVNLGKNLESTKRNVFQIANGSADKIERASANHTAIR